MEEAMPETYAELAKVFRLLEDHYRDMQDIEFTVERGHLWMLQTRTGKRTAKAALKIAVDMATEGQIGRASCRERVCQYVEISVVAVSLKQKKKQQDKNTEINITDKE